MYFIIYKTIVNSITGIEENKITEVFLSDYIYSACLPP